MPCPPGPISIHHHHLQYYYYYPDVTEPGTTLDLLLKYTFSSSYDSSPSSPSSSSSSSSDTRMQAVSKISRNRIRYTHISQIMEVFWLSLEKWEPQALR